MNDKCKIALCVFLSFTLLVASVAVSIWIAKPSEQELELNEQLASQSQSILCAKCSFCLEKEAAFCSECNKDVINDCREQGWEFFDEYFSPSCLEDREFAEFLAEETSRAIDTYDRRYRRHELARDKKKHLKDAVNSYYNESRFIAHFVPSTITYEDDGWKKIQSYIKNSAIYTVSSNLANLNHEGGIQVPRSGWGIYNIYAKLTFACSKRDDLMRTKRTIMEVMVQRKTRTETILRDVQEATCGQKGDVMTLYQSGLFRLWPNNKIVIRYKSDTDIDLVFDEETIHKSNVGVSRFGMMG